MIHELSKAPQNRNILIDFIRGVAIVFVVFGHNIQFGSGHYFYESQGYFYNAFFQTIYSFHMPLFALLSGYLFYWSMKRPAAFVFRKRVTSLIVPVAAWATMDFILTIFTGIAAATANDMSIGLFLKSYISLFINSLWFLWAMFLCGLIVLFVEKVWKGKRCLYLLLIIPMLILPPRYNSQVYIFMYPYFTTGFLYNKFNGKNWTAKWSLKKYIVLCSTVFLIFVMLLQYYEYSSFIYTSGITVYNKENVMQQLGIDLYRWVIGYIGSVLVITLCYLLKKMKKFDATISLGVKLGQVSLGIYILNTYINKYLMLKITYWCFPNFIIWSLETIIMIFVSYILTKVMMKTSIVSKVLFGGRG